MFSFLSFLSFIFFFFYLLSLNLLVMFSFLSFFYLLSFFSFISESPCYVLLSIFFFFFFSFISAPPCYVLLSIFFIPFHCFPFLFHHFLTFYIYCMVLSLSNSYSKIVRFFKYKDPLFFFIVSQSLPFYSLFLTYLCIRLRLLPVLFICCHVFSLFTFFFCSPIAACQANCLGGVAICVTRRIASV